MKPIRILFPLFIVVALVVSACAIAITQPPLPSKQLDLQLANHLVAGMPEQDVYVEVEPGSDQVRRITADEQEVYQDAPAYGSPLMIEHDPFQLGEEPLGPYAKGAELGFTVGEWLAATANGTYTVTGDEAEIDLTFQNLVPGGVYTLWCARVFVPPNFKIVDIPCGNPDGSESTFTAEANGNAVFRVTMEALPDSTAEMVNVIAAAYHSDGQTYGDVPGDFGLNSHVQILAMLPAPNDEAWQTISNAPEVKNQ